MGSPGTRERVLHAERVRMLKGLEASKSRGRKFKILNDLNMAETQRIKEARDNNGERGWGQTFSTLSMVYEFYP